jgi:hypothetical protein
MAPLGGFTFGLVLRFFAAGILLLLLAGVALLDIAEKHTPKFKRMLFALK